MRNKAIEYPHPVLTEYSKDFKDSNFSINILSHKDDGTNILLEIEYLLNCAGIVQLLKTGKAKLVIRAASSKTSFRQIFDMNIEGKTVISIPKQNITDTLEIEAMIVSLTDYDNYNLSEFNPDYFGNETFSLRKGDIIANEPGIKIKLSSIIEKEIAGIVLIRKKKNIDKIEINYATREEKTSSLSNYIVINLPENEYNTYFELRTKKHLKESIDRFLQCSLVLPAIAEAISKLRYELRYEQPDVENEHYEGTVWANSIIEALKKIGVNDLSGSLQSSVDLANRLLGNVVKDSLDNLMKNMTQWTNIRQEDEA